MKRRDLEKHLSKHGCVFKAHGGNHDTWINPSNGTKTSVPRHREVRASTALSACKQLMIPRPANVK